MQEQVPHKREALQPQFVSISFRPTMPRLKAIPHATVDQDAEDAILR